MVRIRLRRVGRKKQPSYRIVVADQRSSRDGRYIEIIGFYNPRTEPGTMRIQEDRALHWLSNGAQPSEAVARILKKLGTLDRFARLNQGEELEALLAEAAAAEEARPEVSPKTMRPAKTKAAKEAEKIARMKAAGQAEEAAALEAAEATALEAEAEAETADEATVDDEAAEAAADAEAEAETETEPAEAAVEDDAAEDAGDDEEATEAEEEAADEA
jgi:small subunit ribosomal protein S16